MRGFSQISRLGLNAFSRTTYRSVSWALRRRLFDGCEKTLVKTNSRSRRPKRLGATALTTQLYSSVSSLQLPMPERGKRRPPVPRVQSPSLSRGSKFPDAHRAGGSRVRARI